MINISLSLFFLVLFKITNWQSIHHYLEDYFNFRTSIKSACCQNHLKLSFVNYLFKNFWIFIIQNLLSKLCFFINFLFNFLSRLVCIWNFNTNCYTIFHILSFIIHPDTFVQFFFVFLGHVNYSWNFWFFSYC